MQKRLLLEVADIYGSLKSIC